MTQYAVTRVTVVTWLVTGIYFSVFDEFNFFFIAMFFSGKIGQFSWEYRLLR